MYQGSGELRRQLDPNISYGEVKFSVQRHINKIETMLQKIVAKHCWFPGSPAQHPPPLRGKAWDETFDTVRKKSLKWALNETDIVSREDCWATFDVGRRKL